MADTGQARAEPTGKSSTLKHPGLLDCQGIAARLFPDLASEISRRVYRFALQRREQFAAQSNLDLMGLSCEIIKSSPFSRDLSHNALRRLRYAQSSVFADHDSLHKHIFPALGTSKDARFKPNKCGRISTQSIRSIVKRTSEKAELGTLPYRDIRSTSLTLFSAAGDFVAADSSSADSKFTKIGDSHETFTPEDSSSIRAGNHAEG